MTAPPAPGRSHPDRPRRDRAADERKLRRLSQLLDSQFRIPGTRVRFGVDALVGLVPGIGDTAGVVASSVVIAQAVGLGARGATLARMILNAVVDGVVGTVPVLGTVFDVLFKANNRNVALLERHVVDPDETTRASRRALVLTLVAVIVTVGLSVIAIVTLLVLFLQWLF